MIFSRVRLFLSILVAMWFTAVRVGAWHDLSSTLSPVFTNRTNDNPNTHGRQLLTAEYFSETVISSQSILNLLPGYQAYTKLLDTIARTDELIRRNELRHTADRDSHNRMLSLYASL